MKTTFFVLGLLLMTSINGVAQEPIEIPPENLELLREQLVQEPTDKATIVAVLPIDGCSAYLLGITAIFDSLEYHMDTSRHRLLIVMPEQRDRDLEYYLERFVVTDPEIGEIIKDEALLDQLYEGQRPYPIMYAISEAGEYAFVLAQTGPEEVERNLWPILGLKR